MADGLQSTDSVAGEGACGPRFQMRGLGLGLGGPWVAQAWPKGHPSVAQGRPKRRNGISALFAMKVEK